MPSPALVIDDLHVAYAGRGVVDGLSLTAGAGRITAVLGPNGAGKTTTIECAEGLRRPDRGTIAVLGHRPGSDEARAAVGVMLQDGGLPMGRSTRDVLTLLARLRGRDAGTEVPALLERLDLADVARTSVRRLSGGQRQRVALGAAMLSEPALLFLDEPSAGLDPHSRRAVWDLVRALRDGGTAVVLTTHLLEEAEALADVVHVMARGRLVVSGSPRELVERHAAPDTVRLRTAAPLAHEAAEDLALAVGARVETVPAMPDDVLVLRRDPAPEVLAGITSWCADHDVRLTALEVGGGTLEDAYLRLTALEATGGTR
ncbi:ABC transporter ATP-binding protein [Litorihabitans aurantiacus]|uniref:ABC transporter ATP-binding protein n=1 Tax=Litorihabitans aurantiacus TaxID=1930061 RepID=A0AA38CT99_9MICO|nr:ABC transporter ATP-binding protein [Litorihabitans aurantiacus]GMA31632.1 ABC transporter ATP-binding protein [Litorihabitans aurantiacus]